ncbi:MAG: hypothetical protein U0175_36175 [Caldilineaceae bacterium]
MLRKNVLFIAYGNPLRRDDGAGLELARRVQFAIRAQSGHPPQFAIRLLELQQLVPELVNEIIDPSVALIVFFDCRAQAAGDKGQTAECEIQICHLPLATCHLLPASFTHQTSPQTLLAMASALYGTVPLAWLVTIPGDDFGMGEGFSPAVSHLLEDAPETARMILETLRFNAEQVDSGSVAQ